MSNDEIRSILSICLLAAYADNAKHDRERDQIKQVAETLGQHEQINLPGLYQDMLLRRVQLPNVAAQLTNEEARQLAYEMAVCVCDADGETSAKETEFLAQLKSSLGLAATATTPAASVAPSPAADAGAAAATTDAGAAAAVATAHAVDTQAQVIANAPLQGGLEPVVFGEPVMPSAETVPHPTAADSLANANTERKQSTLSVQEMDAKILKASIVNGAIELLPENLSTLAIIPLQMRLVYQIGETYGYELDRGHIKDLLAALGVGLTSQYLEQAGRKLLGRVLGGGLFGGVGRQAVSSGMSFASTYALGHVANQYYAGGRTLSTQMLKSAYEHIMQDGRALQTQYAPQMQDMARNLNTAKILEMVRGR
ncbi:TerB family tellurite resistance protein [Diaphorobacter aerolatus]|uniref:TerB family tellurite resistance protein n=1 Tax=Diaphorobacter aerolatus TaxID=1288495 RepID=A0A7H0GJ05_9BURK|nr:TerB family tellurite resistance protein [Diaphorobacter aerolatus]QNP48271.1 TerB family tellurite resistance protein [Diaphorobacter aerolatus]